MRRKRDLVHPVTPQKDRKLDGYRALTSQRRKIRELYEVLSLLCESEPMTRGEASDLIRTLTELVRAKGRTKLARESKRLALEAREKLAH